MIAPPAADRGWSTADLHGDAAGRNASKNKGQTQVPLLILKCIFW